MVNFHGLSRRSAIARSRSSSRLPCDRGGSPARAPRTSWSRRSLRARPRRSPPSRRRASPRSARSARKSAEPSRPATCPHVDRNDEGSCRPEAQRLEVRACALEVTNRALELAHREEPRSRVDEAATDRDAIGVVASRGIVPRTPSTRMTSVPDAYARSAIPSPLKSRSMPSTPSAGVLVGGTRACHTALVALPKTPALFARTRKNNTPGGRSHGTVNDEPVASNADAIVAHRGSVHSSRRAPVTPAGSDQRNVGRRLVSTPPLIGAINRGAISPPVAATGIATGHIPNMLPSNAIASTGGIATSMGTVASMGVVASMGITPESSALP